MSLASPAPKLALARDVPTPPAGVALVIRAANDPRISLDDLARLIEREPSLTVHLLKLANSALFSTGREVKTVGQATVMLGSRVIRNIAVAHAVTSLRRITDVGGFDVAAFWQDSLRRACAALVLARVAGYEDPSEAFTVGLIQDLGVFAFAAGGHGDRIQAARGFPCDERIRMEIEITGRSHSDQFVVLAREWGLPKDLVDAVALHHGDLPAIGERRTLRLAEIARTADIIADVTQTRAAGDTIARAQSALASLESRKPLVLQTIIDLVAQEMNVQSRDIDIHIEEQPSFESLLEGANQALVRISDSYETLTKRLEQLLHEKEDLARQLAASNASLQRLANTDALTGVGNRRMFMQALEAALADIGETGQPSTLIMLDLDHFKVVNDTLGHGVGDDVLVAVAGRLIGNVRDTDTVGRLGGEEFGILMPGCAQSDAVAVAQRLNAALREQPIGARGGSRVAITGSLGAVTLKSVMSASDALGLADQALYFAKDEGRDRVCWVDYH